MFIFSSWVGYYAERRADKEGDGETEPGEKERGGKVDKRETEGRREVSAGAEERD